MRILETLIRCIYQIFSACLGMYLIYAHFGSAQLFRLARRKLFFEAGVDSSVQGCNPKADGSRERSEPWSEGEGNSQL